jgi:hypothetical protein
MGEWMPDARFVTWEGMGEVDAGCSICDVGRDGGSSNTWWFWFLVYLLRLNGCLRDGKKEGVTELCNIFRLFVWFFFLVENQDINATSNLHRDQVRKDILKAIHSRAEL